MKTAILILLLCQDRMQLLEAAARGKFQAQDAQRSWLLNLIDYGNAHQVDVLRSGIGPLLR